jgi:hypothetical protein
VETEKTYKILSFFLQASEKTIFLSEYKQIYSLTEKTGPEWTHLPLQGSAGLLSLFKNL